jgi:hypothetical protein
LGCRVSAGMRLLRAAPGWQLRADTARRKVFPGTAGTTGPGRRCGPHGGSPLFRTTSCVVAYAHGMADDNGHFGIRELRDICCTAQVQCGALPWTRRYPTVLVAAVAGLGGSGMRHCAPTSTTPRSNAPRSSCSTAGPSHRPRPDRPVSRGSVRTGSPRTASASTGTPQPTDRERLITEHPYNHQRSSRPANAKWGPICRCPRA